MDIKEDALELMAAQAKKRWFVTVAQCREDTFTVWATDEEEAMIEVVQKGQGRPAGSKGPEIVGVKAREDGAPQPENAEIVDNAQSELDPTVKPLIEVVRG
jgi:hypothetical protein